MTDTNLDPHPPLEPAAEPAALETTQTLLAVAAWAQPFLAGEVPAFGTAEWLALGPADPRYAAAVVRAALAWWRAGEPLEMVAAADEADRMKAAIAASGPYGGPTHAELVEHRWLADHRPTDHPGGAVAAW